MASYFHDDNMSLSFDMRFYSQSGSYFHNLVLRSQVAYSSSTRWVLNDGPLYDGRNHTAFFLHGTDLGTPVNNLPTTGTITSWDFGIAQDGMYDNFRTVSGFAVDAAVFSNALLNDQIGALFEDVIFAGDDTLLGAGYLLGYGGNDVLTGSEYWDDTLDGGSGDDRMEGLFGDDTYVLDSAGDLVVETAGNGSDTIDLRFVPGSSFTLPDHVENVTNNTSAGLRVEGTADANRLTGSDAGNDRLYGHDGIDVLGGRGGDDYLYGGAGDDTLTGGTGYDRMIGGTGNDRYVVTDITDNAIELAGEGTDRVLASVNHQLRDYIEELELSGTADLRGYGNGLDNLIIGNGGANLLYGRGGVDTLRGAAGNDILFGEDGNDLLTGGAGSDRMYGGSGADRFIFTSSDFGGTATGSADRIHDFSATDGDLIDLSAVDANASVAGDQAFNFVGDAAFSGVAGELRTAVIAGNSYLQGDTNGDGAADFWIRVDGLHAFVAGDFIF